MFCTDIPSPSFLIFSDAVSPILYYSHVPTSIAALLLSLFVFWKKRGLSTGTLLGISILFTLWNFVDLTLWAGVDSRMIMTFWSTLYLLQALILACAWYFTKVFLYEGDVPFWQKVVMGWLLLPLIVLLPTDLNLSGFDLANCEAQQGILVKYFYFFQIVVLGWIFISVADKIQSASDRVERRRSQLFALGMLFFLVSFSWGNFFGSLTLQWQFEQYGLFGMPVFLAFLSYLIVRYEVFDIKLIGAQALVVAQLVLIGSMFFFVRSVSNHILVSVTLIITLGAGWSLIRSVKKEVERKEELQLISDSLASANERLRRLDNAKSEFISIASHQLRTPLTAIKGYVSLILEGSYGKISPEVEDVLEKVYGVEGQLSQLVEDLLNVSRIESGRIKYQYAPARLEVIVTDLIDMFSIAARDKGVSLKMHLSKKVLPEMVIDAGKIKETISNLIDNAIKYTPQSGLVRVALESDEQRRVARIIVEDTGVGIHPEDKSRLFEKFVRSQETTKMVTSGSGLGLYVGKNFVEAHGGRIWAESEGANKGAKFVIELPFTNPNAGKTEMATFEKSYERDPARS